MNPLYLIPLSVCMMSSCTLADWQTQTSTTLVVQTSTPVSVTDTNITTQVLTEAYQEELLAHDIYTYMVERYPELSEVSNIINSEDTHREQVGRLVDARGIARPTEYGIYSDTYTTLRSMIDSSLTGAIEVGVMVETGDIDHLLAEYQKVTDTDIRRTFENIGGGSFNHLRAFLTLARQYNYTVTTDWSRYLTVEESTSTGSLKPKMTTLLEANGLPTS